MANEYDTYSHINQLKGWGKRGGLMKMTFTLPEKLLCDLKLLSATTGIPMAVLVRKAIKRLVKEELEKKVLDSKK